MKHAAQNGTIPCGCGRPAAVEKAGRTLCRPCADQVQGYEFPIRNGRWRRPGGSIGEAIALQMIEPRTAHRLRTYSGHSEAN